MHALIKNNEGATIVALAILPMLFVSIDRKYLPLIGFKTSQPSRSHYVWPHQPCRSDFPVVLPFEGGDTYLVMKSGLGVVKSAAYAY